MRFFHSIDTDYQAQGENFPNFFVDFDRVEVWKLTSMFEVKVITVCPN